MLSGEILLAGACLYGMDGLAHLHLNVVGFAWLWSGLALALGVAATSTDAGWRSGLQIGLLASVAGLIDVIKKLGITPSEIVYLTLLTGFAVSLYRWGVWRLARAGHAGRTEPIRLIAAGLGGLAVAFPFLTDHLMGGTDANWYGMMMMDFIHQARSGVFPIFVGQGESAFNGGVHPFRSAPWHLWLGGLLDLFTLRSLSVLAIQHLTVVVSAVGASLGMYLALGSLAPTRRWLALAVTFVFVCCPAQLAAIYASEAYMTFMAYPWIVMVLHGNALTFKREEGPAGWWCIAVGLALTWLSHPSVGVYATITTVCLQTGWMMIQRRAFRRLALGMATALAWVLLTFYYFVSMTETVPARENGNGLVAAGIIMGGLALVGGLWAWEQGSRRVAVIFLLLGLAAGLCIRQALLVYVSITLLLYAATRLLRRWCPRWAERERRLEWIGGVLLVSLFLAGLCVGTDFAGKGETTDFSLGVARDTLRHTLAPVPPGAVAVGGFQAGWAVIVLFVISLTGGALGKSAESRVFAWAGAVMALLYLPLPYLAEFFWGNLPSEMVTVMSIAFDRRIFPVLIPLLAFAGTVALRDLGQSWLSRTFMILLVGLLPWSGWEAAKFVRRGFAIRNPWLQTKNFYRPDTFVLTRYAYDMLKLPGTLSHGVMDYRLETRVLNEKDFSNRLGPDEYAREMERGGFREITVTGKTNLPGSAWLIFSPPLEIAPNQDWVLRFDLTPNFPRGYLILPSANMLYREYLLPVSGFGRSFGMEWSNHHVITLQNFTAAVQRYEWEYQRSGNFSPTAGEGVFAKVTISRFDAAWLPVRVTSLLPYRATLNLDQAGWLETFRSWLPGYAASVNGRPVEVRESPEHLVMLHVPAGHSEVEVRFVGTRRLWAGLVVSAAAWVVVLGIGVVGLRRRWSHG